MLPQPLPAFTGAHSVPPPSRSGLSGSDAATGAWHLRLISSNMASANDGPQWGPALQPRRVAVFRHLFDEADADCLCLQESVVLLQALVAPSTLSATSRRPGFVRSRTATPTHAGHCVIYVNTSTCRVVFDGCIAEGADAKSPAFPVMVIEPLVLPGVSGACPGTPSPPPQVMLCCVHLHPFPAARQRRRVQLKHIARELQRLARQWRLDTGRLAIVIAGDCNMMSHERPPVKLGLVDCWNLRRPGGGAGDHGDDRRRQREADGGGASGGTAAIGAQGGAPRQPKSDHTFGGDNDYNHSGVCELLVERAVKKRQPFLQRYDRVMFVDDRACRGAGARVVREADDSDDVTEVVQAGDGRFVEATTRSVAPAAPLLGAASSSTGSAVSVTVLHGQRFADGRVVFADEPPRPLRECLIGDRVVRDVPGRLLSDHASLLFDIKVQTTGV